MFAKEEDHKAIMQNIKEVEEELVSIRAAQKVDSDHMSQLEAIKSVR